jgi:transketolase
MNIRESFADTMHTIGMIDPKLVVLVGDISHGLLHAFRKECPERYYNVGILEPTIISMAAGLSSVGFHPVVHTIAPFITERSFEQLKLDFCYQGLGGNVISVGSAFDYSGLGCSHHCYDDLGIIKSLPGTQVLYPAMPNEFIILFKETYRNNQLTYFRLPGKMHNVKIEDNKIALGKGIIIKEGSDVTIVAVGPQLSTVMKSIDTLANKGIDAEVLYFPTIKPFDSDLLNTSVKKTKRVLVIEEHVQFGGINNDVLHAACSVPDVKYAFINIADVFSRGYGSYEEHCDFLGFNVENVQRLISNLF